MRPLRLGFSIFAFVFCLALGTSASATTTPSVNVKGPVALSVGTTVTWSAGLDVPVKPPMARLVSPPGSRPVYQYRWQIIQNGTEVVFRDFNTVSEISWIPVAEGSGTLTVIARDPTTLVTQTTSTPFSVTWPASATGSPAIIPGGNPLTAIYRSPCRTGHSVRARYAPVGTLLEAGTVTPWQTCATENATFIIAGMKASTTYEIAPEELPGVVTGTHLMFTT